MRENIQRKMNVRTELARLQTMELDELKNYWREVYGKEAPDCGKVFLRKQLSFRVQELQYGGISETAQAVLVEAGNLPKLKPNSGGVLPGTRFERDWKGEIHVVIATATGFEYKNQNSVLFPEWHLPLPVLNGTEKNFSE